MLIRAMPYRKREEVVEDYYGIPDEEGNRPGPPGTIVRLQTP